MHCSKGSSWRKWDLHIHTPDSILNNQFGADWDNYVKSLFKKAIKEDIRAIGITDYFLPTGYIKLRKEYLENQLKMKELFSDEEILAISKILVVANVEFRLDTTIIGKVRELSYNRRLNYHVIISNDVPCDILMEEFIQKIKFPFDAKLGTSSETRTLNKRNLIEYGKQIKSNQGFTDSDLYVGVMCASVNLNQIIDILNNHSDLKNNYMLGLPADEDLSEVNWNSSGYANRKDLIVKSHFIFSSNDKTRQFLHGEFNEFHLSEFGTYKACLWGSDAHDLDKLFKPDHERHTWIKSDTTFKGLYQVIHEPKTRAHIGPSSPDRKLDYQVIDSVRFIEVSDGNAFFPTGELTLNPYLNSIIGGKSSGKSMLLYHIAKTINADIVEKRLETLGEEAPYTFDNLNVEVTWRDGTISRLLEENSTRPITYIPQLYINKLSEKSAQLEFNKLVLEILSQDIDFKSFNAQVSAQIQATSDKTKSVLIQLSNQRKNAQLIVGEIAKLGSKDLVKNEILRIQNEIKKLSRTSNFSPEEQRIYEQYTKRYNIVEKRHLEFALHLDSLTLRVRDLESAKDKSILDATEAFYSALNPDLTENEKSLMSSILNQHLVKAHTQIYSKFADKKIRVERLLNKTNNRLSTYGSQLNPLLARAKDAEKILTLNKQSKALAEKLSQIKQQNNKLIEVKERGKEASNELKVLTEQLIIDHLQYVNELQKDKYQFSNGLNVRATVEFDHTGFEEFISCFDRRQNVSDLLGGFASDKGFNFATSTYSDDIWNIYKNCQKEDVKLGLKSTISFEHAIELLFKNWLDISYNVSYKEDDIIRMSPGKRGLVLLNIILQMSNSSDPVLIDQPEDNLDNRTIYDQLREFVIQNKQKRQIIMVTHNANLVVSTDSECIIVSNQNGQDENNHDQSTKFDYFSGSLENSHDLDSSKPILQSMGIREHVCQLLEGGELAFKERERKYGFE
ncbi:hypothetical protein A9263_10270 [Vibrio cyclitrophicus]|uniref:TrlF family AAA-like ATPase n=1 Tax=Vibrio cyclitrophicus TaxID=47951 RepID=UPI0007EEEB2D|nr:hypothetical protein [Vibrio cyclitrophicus]OBT23446.1 hypothetical protein A9263_10270 [Vibrio cyclitrophicus]